MATFGRELVQEIAARGFVDGITDLMGRFLTEAKATPSGTARITTSEKLVDDQSDQKFDWSAIVNNDRILPLVNRLRLVAGIARLKTKEERDFAEKHLGKVLAQLRDGFYPPREVIVGMKVSEEPRKGGAPKKTEEPVFRNSYPKGYEPEKLTKNFLVSVTASDEAVDVFLSLILREERDLREALAKAKRLAKKTARKTGRAASKVGKIFLTVLGASFLMSIVFMAMLVISPSPVALVGMIISLATLGGVLCIPLGIIQKVTDNE